MKEERKVRKEAEKSRVEEQSAHVLKDIDNIADIVNDRIGAYDHVLEEFKKISLEAVKEYANAKM